MRPAAVAAPPRRPPSASERLGRGFGERVVAAGFPVVATTSGGVAATLGYEDHEGAPGDEMIAAAARIATGVAVPVTVDAEAGYGMEPAELVAALRSPGRPAATSRTPTTPRGASATQAGTPNGCGPFARRRRSTTTGS